MDTGPQKESDTSQEAGRHRREREEEKKKTKTKRKGISRPGQKEGEKRQQQYRQEGAC